MTDPSNHLTRRQFTTTATTMAAASAMAPGRLFARERATLRAAWIGTGSRGGYDVREFLRGCEGVELAALVDVLPDRVAGARNTLKTHQHMKNIQQKITVTDKDCYVGFDGIDQVLARGDIDIMISTTPPGFRPAHAAKAVDAGVHMFLEKPGCVDPVGYRSLIETEKKARAKGISIVVGTQQRRMPQYIELMRRVKEDGAIGDLIAADIAWHWDNSDWHYEKRQPGWSDMEWQIRCWPYFTWLSGDHVVEQHLHNLDVANWAMGLPREVMARGGRIARTDPSYGHIYDHFAGTYIYGSGQRIYSSSSQIKGATGSVYESLVGSKGRLWVNRGGGRIEGENAWTFDGQSHDGCQKQFQDLVQAIRTNEPLNEMPLLAEATLMAIAQRTSAYTGRAVKLDWIRKVSKLDLTPPPEKMKMGDLAVPPVAIPGKTKLF